MPDLVLSGVRWSGLVASRCARRVWLEHHEAERDEPDGETRQRWARGRRYEEIVAGEVLDELAAWDIEAERQAVLDWPPTGEPIGQTHVDIVAPVGDAIRLVEIKSNTGADLTENAALQVSGQALVMREQTRALLNGEALNHEVDAFVAAIDTHTGERHDHRIEWEHYQPAVEELWLLARSAVDADEMPARVAEFPSDARCMWCPFKASCWEGWEPPPIDQVLGLDQVAEELARVDGELKLLGERGKKLRADRDELRGKLRPYLPVNELVDVGKVRVKLTVFEVETFALGEAKTAGLHLPPEFEDYLTKGPREKWTVKP